MIKNNKSVAKVINTLKVLVLALILSVGISYVFAAGAPSANPPTCPTSIDACNSPVHTGLTSQTKTGDLWVNGVLGANTNAFINGRLGIGLGAGVVPTASLDLAGTFKYRGDPISDPANVPGDGKILVSDANGSMKWKSIAAGLEVTQSGWHWFDPNAGTISSCFSRCIIPITFTTPYPADVMPMVTVQPQWITYTNFGANNISGASTWGVTNVTNTGFDFVYHSTYNNTYGDTGLMWTATYKPGTNTVTDVICEASYYYSGTGNSIRNINWLLRLPAMPAGQTRSYPLVVRRSNGSTFRVPSSLNNIPITIESSTESRNVFGSETKTFRVNDRNGGVANPSCTLTRS